jgi:TRAP-type mannitol/chloroaromatic compound transport system substrate-binding protein
VGGIVSTELWHGHKRIETPADLEGVKFRAAGAWSEVLAESFDAAPVFVTGGEVYTMLERNGIDLAEWSGPYENKVAGLETAADYIMMPGTHYPAGINEFIVRAEAWDALPEDLQQIVTDAAKLAVFDSFLISGMLDLQAMDELRASNAEIVPLSDEVVDAITDAGRAWAATKVEEMSAGGDEWMAKISESYFDFQDMFARNSIYRHYDRQ